MIDISLLEIKNRNNSNPNIKDISDKMIAGKYDIKSNFAILYLYDITSDSTSTKFVSEFGGRLHNLSSSNVSIITYYSLDMVNNWSNVQFREKIKCEQNKSFFILNMVDEFKRLYDVEKLPAMVVIKNNKNGEEESCNIDLSIYKDVDIIYSVFEDVIKTINDNCEQDFTSIAFKLCGTDANIKNSHNMSNFNTYNYVADLVKNECRERNIKYTQTDLAEELGICVRGLRNKRNGNSFTRDECLYLAIRFGISIQELNSLLRQNNNADLGMNGRDGLIRNCLLSGFDVYQTDDQLKRYGFSSLIRE